MSEAELIDRYIDALHRDPKAGPPAGLDAETAAFVRRLVLSEKRGVQDQNLQERIWYKALTQADSPSGSFGGHKASSNGVVQNVTRLKPNEQKHNEEDIMNETALLEPQTRVTPGTRPPEARYLLQYTATIAAVVIVIVLVGSVLIQMVNGPGHKGTPGQALALTDTPTPVPGVITADNVNQLQLLNILGRGVINHIAWSPDGKTLALGSSLGITWLYDVNALDALPRMMQGQNWSIVDLTFNPDGTQIASVGIDNVLQVQDVATGKILTRLDSLPNLSQPPVLAFSPDAGLLVEATSEAIRLQIVGSYQQPTTIISRSTNVTAVAVSPDGKTMVSGGQDNSVRLWNTTTKTQLALLQGHKDQVTNVVFSPNGKMLASGSKDGEVILWDTITDIQKFVLQGHTDAISQLVFSPDGKTLASASSDHSIRLWSVENGQQLAVLSGHTDAVTSIAFSPDGASLASSSADETLRLWSVATGKETQQISLPQGQAGIPSAAFSPDSKTLVSAGIQGSIILWDVATGKPQAVMSGHTGGAYAVAFSPDGTIVASGGQDMDVRLWDAASRESRAVLTGHTTPISSVAFSPDGRLLASGSNDGEVRLWDVKTGAGRTILKGHTDVVWSLAFSPDGKTLASASNDGTIHLWDIATSTTSRVIPDQGGAYRLAFSPDGKTLAVGGADKTIRLWDAATGAPLAELKGHEGLVFGLGYSPDGSLLASGAGTTGFRGTTLDTSIRLWDVATGKQLSVIQSHIQSLDGTIFSPDGTRLVSFSDDGTIRIWGLPPAGD